MCERADRQCHNTMIQKHLELGERESFAHIVHKVEDLLQKARIRKQVKKTMLIWVLIVLCFITAKANLGLIIGQMIVYKGTHKII